MKGLQLKVADGKRTLLHKIKSDGGNPRSHTTTPTPLTAELLWDEILPAKPAYLEIPTDLRIY